ncbi:MAG: amino acid permease [Acidobacteria bacterium]|nr:amino acid permease [Acidobacteriota bacterium]
MKPIGFWTAVALVVGNMIGSGVFLLPASLAKYGGIGLLGWLVSTIGAVLLALVFARLARLDPAAGGPYAYTRRAFGDLAGFLVAWGYWISCWCTNAALAVAFVGYLDPFFPTVVRQPAAAALMAIATVWLLTAVNIRGVRAAGQVQVVTTVLKILPLVAIGVGGLFVLQASRFGVAPAGASSFARDLGATTTLTLWAFLGLECATIPAGSVRDPARTIPRATMTATLLAAVIYIVSTIGVMGIVEPAALGRTPAPFAEAARAMWGEGAASVVALGAAVSCFGALNGWILVVGQLPMAVAADGLFPRAFGRLSSRGTPVGGMLISGVLATALIGMNYTRGLVDLFTFIILLATLSTLIPYVFCSLAEFLTGERGGRRPRRAAIIAALAFVYSLGAIAGAGTETIYWGFLLLLAGLPVYVGVVRHRMH